MKTFLVVAQYEENYGAHSWDGQGECPQYWKMKGGDDFIVTAKDKYTAVEMVKPHLYDNNYAKSYIVHHEEVAPDYMTEFEKNQLEYDGEIMYPAKRLTQN
jgi:hypothetical protein